MTEHARNNFESLVDYCLTNAERLKIEFGEFYPFGAIIELDGTISQVDTFEGDDYPLSASVIDNLKQYLETRDGRKLGWRKKLKRVMLW